MALDTIKLEGNRLTLEGSDGFASVTTLTQTDKLTLFRLLQDELFPTVAGVKKGTSFVSSYTPRELGR